MKLKPYKTQPTGRGTGLTCPRHGCGGKFIVNLTAIRKLKAERGIKTITCPYCSAVSLLPDETSKT